MAAELPCPVGDWNGYRDTVSTDIGRRIPTSIVEGLGHKESEGLLAETLWYDQAIGLMSQGVAVDLHALRQALLDLLSNPQTLQKMGVAGRKRISHFYDWPVVFEQWRLVLKDLSGHRLHAKKQGHSKGCDMHHWLPAMAEAYGAYASRIHCNDTSIELTSNSLLQEAHIRTEGALDRWNSDLHHQLRITQEEGVTPYARLQNWLLKQGFFKRQLGV